MRTALLTPLLIALSGLLPSCSEFGSYRLVTDGFRFDYGGSTALREESGPLPAGTRVVRVDHRFGDVDVAPRTEGEGPAWRWTVETWADEPEVAEELAREIALVVEESEGAVTLRLDVPPALRRELRGLRSTLEVRADGIAALDLTNRHGDSRAQGVEGDAKLSVAHGDLEAADLAGRVTVEQRFGELDASSLGPLDLSLEHGRVDVSSAGPVRSTTRHASARYRAIGGDLVVDSRHGDLEVVDAGHVTVETAHGHMRIRGAHGARIEAEHGDVDLGLVAGEAQVDARHGSVDVVREALASGEHGETRIECTHGRVRVDLAAGAHAHVRARFADVLVRHAEDDAAALEASASHGTVRSTMRRVNALAASAPGAIVHVEHGDVRTERLEQ
ncbi:MAG: hypothetical protein AAFU73_23875 [Planctomycetota bacterium]